MKSAVTGLLRRMSLYSEDEEYKEEKKKTLASRAKRKVIISRGEIHTHATKGVFCAKVISDFV